MSDLTATDATVRAGARSDESVGPSVALELVAVLALAGYSGVVAASLIRVYGEWSFLPEALVIVAVGHFASFLLRRTRLPAAVGAIASSAVVALLCMWTVHPETFRLVFPTRSSIEAVARDLRFVGEEFTTALAPVAYESGWATLGIFGLGAVAWLADAFAFSARGRGEALVPGAVLFVFVAALGTDRLAIPLTVALIAAGVAAVAALRANFAAPPRTNLGPRRRPVVALIPAAVVLAGVIAVSAWAIGPRLPGADAEPWVDTRGQGGGGVTEVISPLVDIRARLVDQTETEMMIVTATADANWRVSTLAQFDGRTWGLPPRSLASAGGDLNDARPDSTRNDQQFLISGLGGRLVPAAADPVQVEGEGLRFNEDSSTLVRTDRALLPGDRYEVESAMPTFDANGLRSATVADVPDEIYLELPADFPTAVREQAAEVTAGATTAYDQALALQDWFRAEFEYSLEVPAGHSSSDIEAFLQRRAGYCEQFAGTMAAMARSVGLPARVAVGFTPGSVDETGAHRVTGRQAHAWPEIWFDGYGWVPFEPTPGRGAPGMESVTGVAPDQDAPPPPPVEPPATVVPPDPGVTTTLAPSTPPDPADAATPPPPDADPTESDSGSGPWRWLLLGAAIVGAVVAAPALIRRMRRRHQSPDPVEHVVDLWSRARRAVEQTTGEPFDPTHTPLEQADDAAPRLPVAAAPMRSLAAVATAARYGPPGTLTDGQGAVAPEDPDRWCEQIEEIASEAMTPPARVRRHFTNWR